MKKPEVAGHRYLTRSEVAEIFEVSPSTITRWAEAGKLPTVKTLGGQRRYEAKTVMELAHELMQEKETNKEIDMEKTDIAVPAMYGDHHVLEVRRILLALPGVADVYASSSFHTVQVTYDPAKVSLEELKAKLDEAGYLGELPVPAETATPATETNGKQKAYFRHTMAYEQGRQVVSFAQNVSYTGRPLWSCPGVGVIKATEID
jgi:excisionase family DNA binding protein